MAPYNVWGKPQELHILGRRRDRLCHYKLITPVVNYPFILRTKTTTPLPAGSFASGQESGEAWLLLPEYHVMSVVPDLPTAQQDHGGEEHLWDVIWSAHLP
jgi:hypothetical protein